MNQFSDEDMRRYLKCFGEDVGPLNDSTRPYWEKRLERLIQLSDSNMKTSSQTRSEKQNTVEVHQSGKILNNILISKLCKTEEK